MGKKRKKKKGITRALYWCLGGGKASVATAVKVEEGWLKGLLTVGGLFAWDVFHTHRTSYHD